ncbi:hypothetical protein OOJ91_16840 [Micromonospora lupini]|uniref:hypothetical protein n=1 Tax=Micromonospora lupini TaxID=285679 RepID=UPI00225AF550|nr:hypothetical protein [Micromonospora lupini]MCX5067511.1 hypothetical protein [Micromonospora lupini]
MGFRQVMLRVGLAAAIVVGSGASTAMPASAASNDSFWTWTADGTDGCGYIFFTDYGEGAPGGGPNDDYITIQDLCPDGHGVMGYAWLDGVYLGKEYNGIGWGYDSVVWDPFPSGNVKAGQLVGIKVCLVDGANDPTPSYCASVSQRSVDG